LLELADVAEARFRLSARRFDRYGKDRGRPAPLNSGDCMAYRIARAHGARWLASALS
jgi:uncharacterized protein with PIN domain